MNREYLEETRSINIYLALIDTLLGINHIYDKALNSDTLIGNFLFYYYGQLNLISIADDVLPIMKRNSEIKSETEVIHFKNIDNITNTNKDRQLGEVYDTLKIYKKKYHNETQFKFNDNIDNIRLGIIDIISSGNLKEVTLVDYDKEKDIKLSITNNKLYLNSQLKSGDFLNKSLQNILETQATLIAQRVSIFKSFQKDIKLKRKIFNFMSDLEIFLIDPVILIHGFLRDE